MLSGGSAVIRKRLVGVVTVKDGWAVQSFGYARQLPLGRPEVMAANLDRWGADEILLQCIDRAGSGPDLALLDKVSRQGLSTPLIYAGGVRSAADGIATIKAGADRICIDALLHDDPDAALAVCEPLGAQAVIAALPLSHGPEGLLWLDYRNGSSCPLDPHLLQLLRSGAISEALVIDWRHEGQAAAFDLRLLEHPQLQGIPLIAFGGLSGEPLLRRALELPQVVAAAQGNFLAYREHAIQALRQQLQGLPLRRAHYDSRTS